MTKYKNWPILTSWIILLHSYEYRVIRIFDDVTVGVFEFRIITATATVLVRFSTQNLSSFQFSQDLLFDFGGPRHRPSLRMTVEETR